MSATPATPSALSSIDAATDWVNSEPLTAAGLRGTVVLVQFCTYSCVNWIRTLPYVRAWASRYRAGGLVVVGAHTPEFSFEHDVDGVRRAMRAMRVEHPIVLDNEYRIWRSFDNRYWPALYLLDRAGRVHYRHFGEGAYDESERAIQRLLGVEEGPSVVRPDGVEIAAEWDAVASPETYVGRANGEGRVDADADRLTLNQWALAGRWTVEDEAGTLDVAPGSIAYRFQARDLNLVMTPAPTGAAVRFAVLLDGQPPGDAHGVDVDEDGRGTVSEPRLYQLVRQPTATQRTFEIRFLDPGIRAWVFTFG